MGISPVPDVKRLTINPETDSYIFLACDGIWNSLNSQEVVDFINERLLNNNEKGDDEKSDPMGTDRLTKVLGELFDHCLAPDTMGDGTGCDNMTAVIVRFKPGFITVKNVITNGSTASSNGSQAAAGEVGNGSK